MNLVDQIDGAFKQEVKRKKIMRLLVSKGATKRHTLKGTPTSKHAPTLSCTANECLSAIYESLECETDICTG